MSKRNILIIVSSIFLAIAGIQILPAIYTTRETIAVTDAPREFFIDRAVDPVDEHQGDRNASFAAAYIIRYFGNQKSANDLSPDIVNHLGRIMPSDLVSFFHDKGYQAKAYHGDLSTLKKRLSEGVPLIVCIRYVGSVHYAVLTGYDEGHLYLADPNTDNVYSESKLYNRVVDNEEFQSIWKSDFLVSDHIYIAVKKNAEP